MKTTLHPITVRDLYAGFADRGDAGVVAYDAKLDIRPPLVVSDIESFVAKARVVHGGRYSYSRSVYTGSTRPIVVTCHLHGDFQQRASSHLDGVGCPECGLARAADLHRISTDTFVERSRSVYGDRYDYSETVYTHSQKKLRVICREHGAFFPIASNHSRGVSGCPQCRESRHERAVREALVANSISFVPQKKFPWLRHRNVLRLDFYLPEYDVAIECQGEGHFEPINFSGKKDDLDVLYDYHTAIERDMWKEYLCRVNGVRLLYFTLVPEQSERKLPSFLQCIRDTEMLIAEIRYNERV